MSVAEALATARAAIDAAAAAPLSRKKAMLAALLLDGAVDAWFAASGGDDALAFRKGLRDRAPAVVPVLDLAAMTGTTLLIAAVDVPFADYPKLGVEDFMVSLYNGRTVQRVLIASPGGGRIEVHAALQAALAALDAEAGRL